MKVILTLTTAQTLHPVIFFLFPTGKRDLKDLRFVCSQAALRAAETALKRLVQNRFQHIINKWQRRWAKYVAVNGEYLDGAVVNTE